MVRMDKNWATVLQLMQYFHLFCNHAISPFFFPFQQIVLDLSDKMKYSYFSSVLA